MERRRKLNIITIFSCYIALVPILQYYTLPFASLNMATILAFLFLAFFIMLSLVRPIYVIEHRLLPLKLYIAFMLVNVILTSELYGYTFSWDNLSSFVRLFFLFVSLLLLGSHYFDAEIAFKVMGKVLFISAIFIFIHLVLYDGFHIRFNPIIEQWVSTDSLNLDLNNIRSGGLYMEPSHYAQSAILYLCYKLFPLDERNEKLDKESIVIILGIIASGSGQGYAILAVIYCIWLFYTMFIEKLSVQKFLLAALSIVACQALLVMALQNPFVQNAVSRFIAFDSDGINIGASALAGRSYTNHYFSELGSLEKMTGIGFGHITSVTHGGYTNSLYSHLIQCGYPSLLFLGFIIVYYFIKGPIAVKVHCVLYAIMITFSVMANPMMLCFFTQFYLGLVKKKDNELYEEGNCSVTPKQGH